MKLKLEPQDTASNRWSDWHILTVAESGFSMLDIYGRNQHGLEIEVIRQFADRVNARDEAGSLHPRAPISAVPKRFFREQADSNDPAVMSDFRRHILEFLSANQTTIHAQRVLIDFHVSPASVPTRYVDATEEVVRLHGRHPIQEVVIFT
jgi:hypothetical protein